MRVRRGDGVGSDEGDLVRRGKMLRESWSAGTGWLELLVGKTEVRIGRLVGGECPRIVVLMGSMLCKTISLEGKQKRMT